MSPGLELVRGGLVLLPMGEYRLVKRGTEGEVVLLKNV